MENKYSKGKIYKIISPHTDKCYVGSTIQPLCNRLALHRKHFDKKKYSSREIMKLGDYKIILIENYPCNSKEELNKREQYFIDTLDCVNRFKAFITEEQKQERIKNYKIEYRKRERTKQLEKEYNKEWRKKNRDKINENSRQKIKCECGSITTKNNIYRHKKSQKHIDWVNSQ